MTSSTKRKATVRCAAANDEEDLGVLFDMKSEVKRPRKEVANESRDSTDVSSNNGSGKLKEFAWMDSDDEAEEKDDAEEEKELEEQDVTVEALDGVQSFGRMVLLAPSLQKRLRDEKVSPEEVAAACRALGRTKFYDHDLLRDLHSELRRLIAKEKLDLAQTNDALQCLGTLNAYDRRLFQEVAKAYRNKTASIDPVMRGLWLDVYNLFKHKGDGDFVQMLEIPPLAPVHPSFRRVRCKFMMESACALGSTCTFSHDPRAPISLMAGATEDVWRARTQVMTEDQYTLGRGAYGAGRGGLGR